MSDNIYTQNKSEASNYQLLLAECESVSSYFNTDGGLDWYRLTQKLFSRLDVRKLDRRFEFDFDLVKYIMDLIESINQLKDYDTSYDGYPLDEILVPEFFKDFIWPSKVMFKPDSRYPDLRVTYKASNVSVDLAKLRQFHDELSIAFKGKDFNLVSIGSLRKSVLLDDVRYCLTNEKTGTVRVMSDGDERFIPIPVSNFISKLIGPYVMTRDADDVIENYFQFIKFV